MNSQKKSIVPCIDGRRVALVVAALAIAGCAQKAPAPAPAPAPVPAPAPAAPPPPAPAAAPVAPPPPPPAAAPAGTPARANLPPATVSRNWDEFKRQAARRMVAGTPQGSHTGKPQPQLLAAPVLKVELNADGSVKGVMVLREPSQAKHTTKLAIDAVYRAAPYGDVSKLPRPWEFVETFLFNDDNKFKPRTLDN